MTIASLALLILSGCATDTTTAFNLPKYDIIQGCVVDATVADADAELKGLPWHRILVLRGYLPDGQGTYGHALEVFLSPPGTNTLWVYDRSGSKQVHEYINNPLSIAQHLFPNVYEAHYLKPAISFKQIDKDAEALTK